MPHLPQDLYECRQPKPNMFIKAKTKHNIYLKKSWMIGDKESDIQGANTAGINNTVLVRSGTPLMKLNRGLNLLLIQ